MPDSAITREPLPAYTAAIDPARWTVLRLDGRNFSRRSAAYRRPFDPDFHAAMRSVVEVLMAETPAVAAHTASDEISLIFAPDTDWFSSRLDKWLSTAASVTGSAMTRHLTRMEGIASCDARAFGAANLTEVVDYLAERVNNSRRNCRNAYAYFGARAAGLSAREAERRAMELTRGNGDIFPSDTPTWERHGALVRYRRINHVGIDPRSGAEIPTTRRRLMWAEIDDTRNSLRQLPSELAA